VSALGHIGADLIGLDRLGIRRSEVLRRLNSLDDPELSELVSAFLRDTERELFDTADQAAANAHDPEVTANKIFRHLSIALFIKSGVVVAALRRVLCDLLPADPSTADELSEIFGARIISPFRETHEVERVIKSPALVSVLGQRINLGLSPRQAAALAVLNKVYSSPEDKVNRMAYHLRPGNLALKINTIMWGGSVRAPAG
jgi:hypothetical protein